jgi:hypothetical protein
MRKTEGGGWQSFPLKNSSRQHTCALLKTLEDNVHVSSPRWTWPVVTSLCRFLIETKVLRSVTFTCYFGCVSEFPGRLLHALARNPRIQEATFCDDAVPNRQYKTQSLKRLSIPFLRWTHELGLELGSLQASECFNMVHSVDRPLDLMLQRLQSHRSLRMLSISATTNEMAPCIRRGELFQDATTAFRRFIRAHNIECSRQKRIGC